MPLQHLQTQLQNIYEIETQYIVSDFLITNDQFRNFLHPASSVKETLFVNQDEEFLDISVYLDHEVIQHLLVDDPTVQLHQGNIEDFFLALEGISHFLYLVWNGAYDRPVTLLELELQAEIDKYIMMQSYFHQQNTITQHEQLHRLLFETVDYHSELDMAELRRYQQANFYAGKYCLNLEKRYIQREDAKQLTRELRRFYRLPLTEKIRRIAFLN